ncbi:hypothetical protein ACU5CE_27435 [Priestia megaterium]|uniref:hypothetical protein n=1 Tax=Priestia megaterium TaxID=1404 RepID=UPI00406BA0D2
MLTLKKQVKQICDRLAPYGWRDLLCKHGLDIKASDLEYELQKDLDDIDRTIKGFEDFSLEGKRGIEQGFPARSLLYHALASPNVTFGVDGSELGTFPTLAEIEIVENYVFGINPPCISDIQSRVGKDETLGIVVFTSEYRPAPETVHQKHADLCFSRTGIARVGTAEPLYIEKNRGFFPDVKGNDYAFRVLPAKYSAYIAVKRKGNKDEFGPMRFIEESDQERMFWVPLHKLFNGDECIYNSKNMPLELNVKLNVYHVNEKIKRIHYVLGKDTGWREPDINQPPFSFTKGIAEWSNNPDFGTNTLVPISHPRFVEPAHYEGKPLTFKVPKDIRLFSSSLEIRNVRNARHAPEYVHIRHRIPDNKGLENLEDLNEEKKQDIVENIKKNEDPALHYIDYTGDGWVKVECEQLKDLINSQSPAYSLVTAVDFFPNCDQRELMNWFEQVFPQDIQYIEVPNENQETNGIWAFNKPETLSDDRLAANITLGFDKQDDTMTAIVSLPYQNEIQSTNSNVPASIRHSFLPDAASGVYAPGWDVSYDEDTDGNNFLAAYGLGSPFPEDTKLCAALSTFWPAVAPDSARAYEVREEPHWPTVVPLTDKEIGQEGELPWDGMPGPRIVEQGKKVEYTSLEYVDYVANALQNKFTLSLTKLIDIEEYKCRVLAICLHVFRGFIKKSRQL